MTDTQKQDEQPIATDGTPQAKDNQKTDQAQKIDPATLKSQIESIRQARQERATMEAQRDESRMQQALAHGRLETERLLMSVGVIYPQDARILLEQQVDLSETSGEQLAQQVQQLVLEKPYLLGPTIPAGAQMPAMTSSSRDNIGPATQLAAVAQRAASSGNRKDIAEYLRLRRQIAAN
jgi:hypothetical protein